MELQPGQTRQVTITLPASAFSYYNSATSAWTEARGFYQVMIGDSSANLPLTARIYVR